MTTNEIMPRTGAARTIDALDFECAALSREFHATADAIIDGMPLPVLRDSFAELARVAARISSIANAQVGALDDVCLEAAE